MKKNVDIHDRVRKFILRIIGITKNLSKTPENKVFTNQIIRSSSSIGANLQEANGAHTKADFTYLVNVSRKEAKETVFWLDLIIECNPQLNSQLQPLMNEGYEIASILSAIVISSKKK